VTAPTHPRDPELLRLLAALCDTLAYEAMPDLEAARGLLVLRDKLKAAA